MVRSIAQRAMAAGNRLASSLYRRTSGKIGGRARGAPVLILTVPGRKSGLPKSVPVAYFEHEGGYLVAATAGGSKTDPQWIRNLAAAHTAEIQIGDRQQRVDVRVAAPAERDELWTSVVVARAPSFAGYESKAGARVIPIAILTPRSPTR